MPKKLVLDFLPPPSDGAQTCGPGPFSMASQNMVTMQLQAAGFENIAFQRNDGTVMVGRDVEQAIQAVDKRRYRINRKKAALINSERTRLRAKISRIKI